ncbi:MAG: 5-formyltetrahydrofolate cyclo-ligase [Phycisphaerales bacterium]|nr:5-formyltetrahydrofolate cyclo-ligase [Phycisphaerales bacterium]
MRRTLTRSLEALSPDEVAAMSARLCQRVLSSEFVRAARVVMVFAPMAGETDVTPIIERALESGQVAVLPWIDWEKRELVARRVTRYPDDLETTRGGLRQPKPTCAEVEVGSIDLVITPGLGFDGYGGRLGRGGGFYDRFFATPGLTAARVGVAFDAQIVDRVPRDERDALVDAVITPTRTIVADVSGSSDTPTG